MNKNNNNATGHKRYVDDSNAMIIAGYVKTIIFDSSLTANKADTNKDDYIIARFQHYILNTPKLTNDCIKNKPTSYKDIFRRSRATVTIKGHLPFKSPYFAYVLRCNKSFDEFRQQYQFDVIDVVELFRNSTVDYDTFNHMCCKEAKMLAKERDALIRRIHPTMPDCLLRKKTTVILSHKLIQDVLNAKKDDIPGGNALFNVLTSSEYCKHDRSHELQKVFPNHAKWLMDNQPSLLKLEALMQGNDRWKIHFNRFTKDNVHPSFKPSLSKSCLELITTLMPSPDHVLLLKLYEKMVNKRKSTGDTFFTAYDLPKEFTMDHVRTLCNQVAGLFYLDESEHLLGEVVFILHKDWVHEQNIANLYQRLCSNANPSDITEKKGYIACKELNSLQLRAVNDVSTKGVINVAGYPGCGKTRVIKEIYDRYENVKVLTSMNSMVESLIDRGISNASTIHKALYDKSRTSLDTNAEGDDGNALKTLKSYENVEILVIDEYEDVPTRLAGKMFSKLYPNLKRVVQVFDPLQIAPIDAGRPALDAIQGLPKDYTIELTQRYRFQPLTTHYGGFTTQDEDQNLISDNDVALVTGSYHLIKCEKIIVEYTKTQKEDHWLQWFKLKVNSSNWVCVEPLCLSSCDPSASKNGGDMLFDLKYYAHILLSIVEDDISNYQWLALTNNCCNIVNRVHDEKFNPNGSLYYANQRLTVKNRSYKCKTLNLKTEALEDKKAQNLAYSDKIRNGESFIVAGIKDFDVETNEWVEPMIDSMTKRGLFSFDKSRFRRCIVTKDGRHLCINDGYVDTVNLQPGWCITVDRSKGREYENVIFCLASKKDAVFNKNHVHVAISRAKKRMILLGELQYMIDIGSKDQRMRKTTLSLLLNRCIGSTPEESSLKRSHDRI